MDAERLTRVDSSEERMMNGELVVGRVGERRLSVDGVWDPAIQPLGREPFHLAPWQVNEAKIRAFDGDLHMDPDERQRMRETIGVHTYPVVVNRSVPQALVIADIGRRMDRAEHIQAIVDHGVSVGEKFDPEVVAQWLEPTGSEIVSWVTDEIETHEFVTLECAVAEELARQVIERMEIEREDIGFVGLVTSSPASLLSAKYVAEALGLHQAQKHLTATACSSSRRARSWMVDQAEKSRPGQWGLLLGDEYLMTLKRERDRQRLIGNRDLGGLVFFSDRAYAHLIDLSYIRSLYRVRGQVIDEKQALPGINTIPLVWDDELSSGLLAESEWASIMQLPLARGENLLELYPSDTSTLFVDVVKRASKHLMGEMAEDGIFDFSWINMASGHRANQVIYENRFQSARPGRLAHPQVGMNPGLFGWELPGLPRFGNAPVVTYADEVWRNISRITRGITEFSGFFAAGANYEFGVECYLPPGVGMERDGVISLLRQLHGWG